MEKNILIKFTAESDLSKVDAELQGLRDREQQILANMKALEAERNKAKAYATTAQQMATVEQNYGKMIEDNVKRLRDVRKEQDNVKKSIESLANSQKNLTGHIVAVNTQKSFRALKREIDEQLRTWNDWSVAGTSAYNKLLAKAGEMNDKMGDTQRMINYMGSDTKGFDTLVDGTQAVSGAFTIAQGAMALFGRENEDLQRLMVNLQSAIAISTGLQQLGNVVQKESNLMMGIGVMQKNALAKAEIYERLVKIQGTSATIGATIAQRAFNLVANANPYVLLGVALVTVVGALYAFTKGSQEAQKSQTSLNNKIADSNALAEKTADSFGEQYISIKKLQNGWSELGGNLSKQKKFITENKDEFEKLGINVENVNDAENVLVKNTQALIDAMKARAMASAAQQIATEKYKQAIEKQIKAEQLSDTVDVYTSSGGQSITGGGTMEKTTVKNADKVNALNEVKDLMTAGDKFFNYSVTKSNEATSILKNNGIKAVQETATTTKNIQDTQNKRNEEIAKAGQELLDEQVKALQDEEQKEIKTLELNSKKRIDEIKSRVKDENNLSKNEKDLIIQITENTEIERGKIESKYRNDRNKKEIENQNSITEALIIISQEWSDEELSLKRKSLEEKNKLAELEIINSIDTEENKATKIKAINEKLIEDKSLLDKSYNEHKFEETEKTLDSELKKTELSIKKQYESGKISKQEYENKIEDLTVLSLEKEIDMRKQYGEETIELEKELSEKRISIREKEREKAQKIMEFFYNFGVELANIAFEYKKEQNQKEIDDIENLYITSEEYAKMSADEKAKNTKKEIISEQALAQKKLELKRKQAQIEKQEALFNIAISTAQAVMGIWKDFPKADFGVMATIMSAATIALGAVQAGIVASKPLPAYAKGRKGGKGEFAKVGELGPEVMWVPDGASIIPAHRKLDTNTFKDFGIPFINEELIKNIGNENKLHIDYEKLKFDYDKLSNAISRNIKQNNISINVDKSGINVNDGNLSTTFLNKKYTGQF